MSDAPAAPPEPLRELLDEWARGEATRSGQLAELLDRLAETLDELDRCDQQQRAAAEEQASRQAAAEDHRRRLEHDLKLARGRVHELEQALQQRTEELLKSQAANNALAAELQSVGGDPLALMDADASEEGSNPAPSGDAAGDPAESVSERFARLRRP